MKIFLTGLAISAVMALAAPAQAKDGAFFLKACDAAVRQSDGAQLNLEDSIASLHCAAYISGFREALALHDKINKTAKLYCPPEGGVSNEQVAREFAKFLQNNPNSLSQSGDLSLHIALTKAYPCKAP